MSQIVDLYNKSPKPRVAEARLIPQQDTDFFDREHKIADGFTSGEKKGDPTQFTEAAQQEYNAEVGSLTPPASYNPQFPLHRYTPETPFSPIGSPKT